MIAWGDAICSIEHGERACSDFNVTKGSDDTYKCNYVLDHSYFEKKLQQEKLASVESQTGFKLVTHL